VSAVVLMRKAMQLLATLCWVFKVSESCRCCHSSRLACCNQPDCSLLYIRVVHRKYDWVHGLCLLCTSHEVCCLLGERPDLAV